MPVPNSMADLFSIASSNSPAGTEAIGNSLDNYLRAISGILRSTNAIASASIASASTTDISGADAEVVQITGTATINSFGVGSPGLRRELRFSGACTIVNGSNIQLGGVNLVTRAGDTITFRCTASGVWTIAAVGGALRRMGDRMYGNLDVGTSGDPFARLQFGGSNQVWLSAYDSTGTSLSANLLYRANSHVWTNSSGSTIGTFDNGGMEIGNELRVGSLGNGGARVVAIGGNIYWDSRQVIGSGLPNANALYRAALHTWTNGTGSGIATLDGSGNFTANGNVTGGSDERVKTNWRDLPLDFLEALSRVKHGVYDRTDMKATQVGVGAQSLQKVLPWAVHTGEDEFLSVAYGNAALVGVIALSQRMLALEARVRGDA